MTEPAQEEFQSPEEDYGVSDRNEWKMSYFAGESPPFLYFSAIY